jgi:hypothetical protein
LCDVFDTLPDELVLAIVARIRRPADIVRFGSTSRRMRGLALDDSLWRPIFQQRHTLVHPRFATFGKGWFWLCRAYSSKLAQGAGKGFYNAWTYCGDVDQGRRPHGYGVGCRAVRDAPLSRGPPSRVAHDRYEGEWLRGYIHGRGIRTFGDGTFHDGSWRYEVAHGYGSRIYADGSRYDGEWVAGARHGAGTHVSANGDIYRGDWERDRRHGRGTLVLSSSGDSYEGEWKNDSRVPDAPSDRPQAKRTWAQVVSQPARRGANSSPAQNGSRLVPRPA